MIGKSRVRAGRRAAIAAVRCLSLAVSALGCAREDVELAHDVHDAGHAAADSAVRDAAQVAVHAADGGTILDARDAYCAGSGPPADLNWPQPSGTAKAGGCNRGLASRVFQYGLCSCGTASLGGGFTLDAFDSRHGPYQQGQDGASLGLDQQLITVGVFNVRGSLITAGSGALLISSSGPNQVAANFKTNAELAITGGMSVGRDLWVNGGFTASATTSVHGNVYQTPGHTKPSGLALDGQLLTQDFRVAEPCACGEPDLLDITGLVAAAKGRSDNTGVGLSDNMLVVAPGRAFDLACGRFVFAGASIGLDGAITAHGRSALFVDGNLTIFGSFGADLGTQGELDVFVTGSLLVGGAAKIGSKERPSALRLYVAGYGAVALTPLNQFAANLYAPHASIGVGGATELYGAFFVSSYSSAGDSQLHYDAAIMQLGDSDANSCIQATPNAGCTGDADCSTPLICTGGRCTFSDARTTFDRRLA